MSQSLGLVNLFWGQPLTYPFQGLHLWEQIQKVRHLEVLCVGAYLQLKMLPMCRHQTPHPIPKKSVISLQSLGLGNKKSETDTMLEMMAQQQAERDSQAPKPKSPVATGASAQQKMAGEGAPPPRAGGLGAFKMPEFPTAQYEAAMGMPMPTEAEIAGTRKRAGEEFEQTMPDRTSQLLNERILRKTEQLQKDKDMTFNEALFAAGAAVLSAPGGGGMKWAGEGLKAFGQTMAQGKKDIRVVRILLIRPTLILHRLKVLGIKANLPPLIKQKTKPLTGLHRAEPWRKAMRPLLFSSFNAQVTAAKAPYEIAESQSKAKYQSAYAKLLESGGPGAATAAAKKRLVRALTLAR
jgi:hypothetical protein